MGFWGWRQTAWMAFISVIVVACSDTAPITPASTLMPRAITLTVERLSGAPPATARPTLAAVTATPKEPDPAPVEILAPECSDRAGDGYQCVGIVYNATGQQHGTVMLHAALYDGETLIEAQTVAIEQRLLLPEDRAPYRFIFDQNAAGPLVLEMGELYPPGDDVVRLEARDTTETTEDGDYVLSAVVANDQPFTLYGVRAVATLYDGEQPSGFRVIDVGTVEAGAEAPLALRWYGVQPSEALWVMLTVTGNKSPAE
jgi:hypothetical protein